jgi:hypothetical protein
MKLFTDTIHCKQRRACKDCRSSQRFRDSIRAVYAVPDDFDQRCPLETAPGVLPPLIKSKPMIQPPTMTQLPDSVRKISHENLPAPSAEILASTEKLAAPQKEILPQTISSVESPVPLADDTLTVTVTGFSGNTPPNGTWKISPGIEGAFFGPLFVKAIPADQGWNLEVSKKCCGGRLTLFATGKIVELGLPFEVVGNNIFSNQKGTGLAEKKTSN